MKDDRTPLYGVVLFQSISSALRAEKILKKEGIAYKLIPVPRHLSSDCGICIRFSRQDESHIREFLTGKVEIQSFCPL
jgi:hypothetical protein